MSKINVHLVDDQALIRQGMSALLQLDENITVTGQSASGNAFIADFNDNKINADVVLLDMRMPDGDGLSVLNSLKIHPHAPKMLILTTFEETPLLLEGMQAGAYGYLLKDISLEELVDAIIKVHQGSIVLQPSLTHKLIQAKASVNGGNYQLTTKEQTILSYMVEGLSNKEIAKKVFNAEGTVRNQVSSILSKLDVRDRTQATLKALEEGLVSSTKSD